MANEIGISWFETVDILKIPKVDLSKIEEWIESHGDLISEIQAFVQTNEIEAAKIIDGEQHNDPEGSIRIKSFEVLFLCNVILIVQSEEKQSSEGSNLSKELHFLGELTLEI